MAASDWRKLSEQLIETQKRNEGATDDEISSVRQRFEKPLPLPYVDFLRRFGRSAHVNFAGEDARITDLIDLQKGANATFLEETGEYLPTDALVFWGHQGYRFFFVHVGESDDPAVYVVEERRGKPEPVFDHLSDFFADAIQNELERPALPPTVTIHREDL